MRNRKHKSCSWIEETEKKEEWKNKEEEKKVEEKGKEKWRSDGKK